MGAQWLSGGQRNPLYYLGNSSEFFEGHKISSLNENKFVRMNGKKIIESKLPDAMDQAERIIEECYSIIDDEQSESQTIEMYMNSKLENIQNEKKGKGSLKDLIEGMNEIDEVMEQEIEILEWRKNIEAWMNGSNGMKEVSLNSLFEFIKLEGENFEFKRGFQKLVETISKDLPKQVLKLNTSATKIEWSDEENRKKDIRIGDIKNEDFQVPLRVHCSTGPIFEAEHVIVTLPLGILKKSSDELFFPILPKEKLDSIKNISFGVVDKIYLEFGSSFSIEGGCSILWPPISSNQTLNFASWTKRIASFHPVSSSSNFLVCWLPGDDAIKMEHLTDEEVIKGILPLLKFCYNNETIPSPKRVIRTYWHNDPLYCGSHSYLPLGTNGKVIDDLALPIYSNNSIQEPRLLFAGEATHRQFYSTTHGAYLSGIREADRLIEFSLQASK